MRRSVRLSVLIALLLCLTTATAFAAIIASDNAESYSGNNYTDENQGTGWGGAFAFKNFGVSDAGGEFLETGTRRISGNQSFGLFANSTGSGRAVSRDFSSALSTSTGYRFSFKVRLDLDTNASKTAGFSLSSIATGSKTNWNDGQRLFVGISGNGLWRFDDGTLKTVRNSTDTADYAATGGDVYRVVIDFQGNNYWLRIFNETTNTQSRIESGTLGGTSGSAIRSIGFANGVTGTNQNVIWDDMNLDDAPTALAITLRSIQASPASATALPLAGVGVVALGAAGAAVVWRRRR